MTKKQLATHAKISTSRITQLMANMTKDVDYVEVKRGGHDIRIEFTAIGIEKVMDRNKQGGRVKVERVKRPRGRPRKQPVEIELPESVSRAFLELNKAAEKAAENMRKALTDISKNLSTIEKGK